MNPKEKQLLLQELCARIPYRTFVCLNPGAYNKPEICALTGVHGEKIHLDVDTDPFRINNIKPYLRSMSSMTQEERREYCNECNKVLLMRYRAENHYPVTDWLLSHHFDFRGLIPMSLALEALPGMYETE